MEKNFVRFGLVICVGVFVSSSANAKDFASLIPQDSGSRQLMTFLKHGDEQARDGLCIEPPKSDPAKILTAAGIKTVNAHPSEIAALAKGVQHIGDLAGGKFSAVKGAQVVFRDSPQKSTGVASGGWNGKSVHIERSGQKPDTNVAHLMHELGHYVGNQEDLYSRYRADVGRPCQYSYRCRHVLGHASARNEEFAEVFAAFILHPEILKKSGPNCQKAYDFFASKIFKNGNELAQCNIKSLAPVVAPPEKRDLGSALQMPVTRPMEFDSEDDDGFSPSTGRAVGTGSAQATGAGIGNAAALGASRSSANAQVLFRAPAPRVRQDAPFAGAGGINH